MKFIHAIISTALVTLATVSQASAPNLRSIGDNQVVVTLSKNNNAKVVRVREEYPGMYDPADHGRSSGRVVQDCLLVQDVKGIDQNKLDLLLDQLEATNGPGIIFGKPTSDDRELALVHTNGRFAFFVTDLSKYVTGIEIRTKNQQKTFGQLVREILGTSAKDVNITLSRGCHPIL